MFGNLISGIPNTIYPFLGITKKLHILHLLLVSNDTLNMANCIIADSLYIFSLIFVSFVATNCSAVALGNIFCKCKRVLYFHCCLCQPFMTLNL